MLLEEKGSVLAGLLMMKRGCNIIPVAYSKKDISLLQKFSPVELKLRLIDDLSELFDDNIVLVSGQNFEDYGIYDDSFLVLRPLIAFDDEEIRKRLDLYKNA